MLSVVWEHAWCCGGRGIQIESKLIDCTRVEVDLLTGQSTFCPFSMAGFSIHSEYYPLSIVAIILSLISASYYLKFVRVILCDSADVDTGTSTVPQESKPTAILNSFCHCNTIYGHRTIRIQTVKDCK